MTEVVKLPELTQINGHLLTAATGTLTVNQVDGTPGPATIYGDEAAATVLSSSGVASWVQGVPAGWVAAGHTYDILDGGTVVARFEAIKATATSDVVRLSQDSTITARIGIDHTPTLNGRFWIGSGTGSLTDKPYMGLKVKIDSDATHTPAGIQNNVNIVDGTPAGSVHGVVSRIDVNDTHSGVAGDTVALWGDVFVRASSGRPVWGINSYTQIVSGVAYSGAAIGAELGVFNDGTSDNTGGVLHLVSRGASKVQFGVLIGEGGSDVSKLNHGIIIKDGTRGPLVNAIYFGDTDGSNVPTGAVRFAVDKDGRVTIGGGQSGSAAAMQMISGTEAFPRFTINADGSISLGSGAAAPVVALRRPGSNQVGTGTNQAWVLGTAAAGGTVYMQSFKQTASPSNPPADGIREFWRLNGSSKIEKVIRKSDGTELVTYTEP